MAGLASSDRVAAVDRAVVGQRPDRARVADAGSAERAGGAVCFASSNGGGRVVGQTGDRRLGAFDTPPPPRVRPPFPTAAPPLIAPELVNVPIAPELLTPSPTFALVEAPADVAAELAVPPVTAPLLISVAIVPELPMPSPPTATADLPLEDAAPPLIVPLFVRVPMVCALTIPKPPSALAPRLLCLPGWWRPCCWSDW